MNRIGLITSPVPAAAAAQRLAPLLVAAALAGCAAGGGVIHLATDRAFDLAAVEALPPGATEADVVQALGLPAAFGVDDRGRRYLQYNRVRIGAHGAAAGTGPIGVGAVSVSSASSGFEIRVFIEGGRVERIARRVFQAAPDAPDALDDRARAGE